MKTVYVVRGSEDGNLGVYSKQLDLQSLALLVIIIAY
jgi:hypothetical protein